jgi:predicted SAM-dependent methyltransferase
MRKKVNYLNVGCGSKYHENWFNVDMVSYSKDVIAANLLKGIPFSDNYFDVVYHSQVLEHFPKDKAHDFIKECYRVLKPGGIIRVVVPDLENIVDEYKKYLKENLENPNKMSIANYDWILLEMYDQTVRNHSGGQMAEFLKQPNLVNEKYVINRIGYVGRNIRNNYLSGNNSNIIMNIKKSLSSIAMFKNAVRYVFSKIFQKLKLQSEAKRIGIFRLGGEVHMWMYDRFSLNRLLTEVGFVDISVKNPFESEIPNWNEYELDVKNGLVYDPTSLFMEARKPNYTQQKI